MKKKTPLIFLLAALSTAAVGAATGCGEDTPDTPSHTHTYTQKSDDDQHWQECTLDGATKYTEAHKDENHDGVCDVCDHAISYSVTFEMHGHGTAPAAQKVPHGTKATEPSVSDVDGYTFDGWYTDDTYAHKFDFNANITEAKVAHAHWVEDYSGNAVVLTLGTPANTKFTADKLYFTFTATEAGRYTVNMMGNTGCTFTVSLKGENNKLVTETANAKYHFSLAAGETVGILVSKPATEWNDDTAVSPIVSECVNEPLPAEGWVEGTYSEETLTLDFKRDGTLIFYGDTENPVSYTYVDGTVYFTYATVAYKLTQTDEDELTIEFKSSNNSNKVTSVLTLETDVEPIEIAKFSGKYEFVAANDKDEPVAAITVLNIKEDGSGYAIVKGVKINYTIGDNGVSYDQKKNTLTWSSFVITVNLDEKGNAVSVKVKAGNDRKVYPRTGDAVDLPAKMPLDSGSEYVSENYNISDGWSGQTFNSYGVNIIGLDGDVYTINHRDTVYNLKLVKNNEDKVTSIELYAEDGTTLIETLNLSVLTVHDMDSDGASGTLTQADFYKYNYYLKATEEGWCKVTATGIDNLYIGYMYEGAFEQTGPVKNGGYVYLNVDDVIVLNKDSSGVATFACEYGTPQGIAEDDPIVLEDGYGEFIAPTSGTTYYFEFTAPKAGNYVVLLTSGMEMTTLTTIYSVDYTVNGEPCGYDPNGGDYGWGGYRDGYSAKKSWTLVSLEENGTIKITASPTSSSPEVLTVDVFESYADATLITGESGTLEAGEYSVLSTVSELTLTSDADFTVTYGANKYTTNEITLYATELIHGLKIEGSASYTVKFVEGTAANPYKVTEVGTFVVYQDEYATITAPEGTGKYIVRIPNDGEGNKFSFTTADGKTYGYVYDYIKNDYVVSEDGAYLVLNGGQSVTIQVLYDMEYTDYQNNPLPITVIFAEDLSFGATALTFTASGNTETATATVSGSQNFSVASTNGVNLTVSASSAFSVTLANGTTVKATAKDGVYTATVSKGENVLFKVTGDGAFTFTLKHEDMFTAAQTGTYTHSMGISLVLNADGTGTYFSLPLGMLDSDPINNITVSNDGDGNYSFKVPNPYAPTQMVTLTFSFNENGTIEIKEPNNPVFPLIKEGATLPDPDEDVFTEEQAGPYSGTDIRGGMVELVLNANGSGSFTASGDEEDITVTATADGYSFSSTLWEGTVTFTFGEDGISLECGLLTADLEKEAADVGGITVTFTEEKAGTYTGTSGSNTFTLTIDIDGSGTFDYGSEYYDPITSLSLEGTTYSGATEYDEFTFTFTESGIELVYGPATVSMTKQA